jgi:hypothetical protein
MNRETSVGSATYLVGALKKLTGLKSRESFSFADPTDWWNGGIPDEKESLTFHFVVGIVKMLAIVTIVCPLEYQSEC